MNDDFKISLVGVLDAETTANNIKGKYGEVKGKLPNIELIGQLDITNTINTINGQLSGITQHLHSLNINANIAGINFNSSQVQQQASVIGNQINNGISQGVNSANNILNQFVNTLHSYRWNDNEIQNAVSEINRLAQQTGITIASLSQSISEVTGKKGTKRVLDVSVEGINQLGQATKLVRQWDLDSGNLVKTTDNLKSGVVATASEMQKLSDQITKVASSYENKVAKIRANVQIGQKPITPAMSADWSQIESQISAINNAIGQFRNSTSATFAQNEAGIKSSITNLEILIKDLQNARYQASVLRANPVEVLRQEAIEKVTQFRNELERAKGDVSQVNNDSIRWLATLNNVGGFRVTGAEIVDILDNIKVARERLNTSNKKEGIDNSLEKVKIQAQSLLSEIEKLEKSKIIPNGFKIDVNGVEKGLENIKNEISLISKTGKGDLSVLSAQFSLFKKELSKMGGSTTANTNFTNSINQWVTEAKGSIKNFDAVFTQTIEHIKTEAASADKIALSNLKSQFSDLKNVYSFLQKMENNTIGATFTQKSEQLKKFGSDGATSLNTLTKAYNSLQTAIQTNDFAKIQAAIKNYDTELKKATSTVKTFTAQGKQINNIANQRFSNQMEEWQIKNTRAAKVFGNEINRIRGELKNADKTKLTQLRLQFDAVQKSAREMGLLGKTFTQSFVEMSSKFATWFGVTSLMARTVMLLRSAVEEVKNVDKAMTELYRVTDLTANGYEKLYTKITKSAQDYGIKLDNLISSTASWVRFGFDTDTAEQLAEISAMYQHVTDLDESTAVKNLLTAYKGYQTQLLELTGGDETAAVERIADIYDKLGNELPVSAAQVAEGMNEWAAIAAASKTTFEEATGLIVGGGSVTQDFTSMGTALKIVTMRLQGMKGKLQELGEEVDENIVSTSKMQTQILNLTHGKVNIFETDGQTFRSTYEILKDISAIQEELTDPERAELLELIAGKNRGNAIQSLLGNWQEVEKTVIAASNAEGTAAAENEKYLASLEGKLTSLKAAWSVLANDFFSSDSFKGMVDGVTVLVNGINTLIQTLGSVPTVMTGLVAAFSFKGHNFFEYINTTATGAANKIGFLGRSFSDWKNHNYISHSDMAALREYNALIDSGVSANAAWDRSMLNAGAMARNLAKDASLVADGVNKGKVEMAGLEQASRATAVGVKLLNVALNTLATVVVSLIINSVMELIQEQHNLRQSLIDTGKETANEIKNIKDLKKAYEDSVIAYNDGIGSKENMISAAQTLAQELGMESDVVQNLTNDYKGLSAAIDEAYIEKLKEKRPELLAAVQATEEETDSFWKNPSQNFVVPTSPSEEKMSDVDKAIWGDLQNEGLAVAGKIPDTRKKNSQLIFSDTTETVDGRVEAYNNLIKARQRMTEVFTPDQLDESEYWDLINEKINNQKDEMEALISARKEYNANVVEEQYYNLTKDDIPKTIEDFNHLEEQMKSGVETNGNYRGSQELINQAIEDYIHNQPAYIKALEEEQATKENNNTNIGVSEDPFLQFKNMVGETVSYTQEEFEKLFSLGDKDNPFDGLINSSNEYVAALKAVDTEMSTVESALKEYNEKGSISVETADKLLKANGKYGDSLVYTQNGIELNVDALKKENIEYIEILKQKYQAQIEAAKLAEAEAKEALSHQKNALAVQLEEAALRKKELNGAEGPLQGNKFKYNVASLQTSGNREAIREAEITREQAEQEYQKQIDLLNSLIDKINNPDFGAYVPPEEKNNASSSTPKTKSYEKNTNAYNWADAWLQDQQNNADKLKTEYDKINKQLDKAIELGDEKLIRSLSENAVEKSKQIQEVQASAASEGRTRYADIMKEIWSMAPELQDKSIDDITEDDLLKVEKRLDDIITKEKNIAVDMYNANNDVVDPNQTAIETAENNAKRWDELIKNAQEYYKAFGEVSGEGSFAEDWAEQGDNIVETVKTTFDAVNDIFDKSVENQQKELDKLDLRIDLLDDDDFSGQMDLIAQKSQINTEIAKNLANQIESIKSEFEDSLLPEDEYKSRMEELEDQYNDCIKAGKEFEDTLKDIAQEQIDNISSVEDNVMSYLEDYLKAVEDNSQKEIDAAEKTADAKKKALDKAKDALKDYQDELEKEWQAEDDRAARQEKLDQRSDLSSQRAKSLAAAASGDLEALSKVEELDKEIADIDKDIQEEATKQIRDMLKDYIAKQEDDLDKQADKIDEEIDLMKQQLEEAQKMNEELLKGESGMALVHALMNGEPVKLNGQEVDLNTIRTSVDTENGNAFSYGYENETSEWQENLTKSLAAVANLESLNELAQGNFTLQNGNILLSNGHSFDTSMLSTTNPNSIVNGLIPVDPNLLPIAPLANGETIMSSLGIGKTLFDNSEVIKKMGDIQKSIDNNNNPPVLTIQGNLLNVEGNVVEDTIPMINDIVAKQIPNALMSLQKGVSRNAALIKYSR